MPAVIGDQLAIDRKARVNTPLPAHVSRPPEQRVCDFEPTFVGLTAEEARQAAACCIHCPDPAPCQLACPIDNDIPSALWFIEQGDFLGAAAVYRSNSTMPEICGRVCPPELLCQSACVRNKHGDPVLTGVLEAFVSDYAREFSPTELPVGPPTGKQVAIVGSGPSGLGCAARLLEAGHQVTIFEKNPQPGGLLLYGIPDFKLPKAVVRNRIDDFRRAGVEFRTGTPIGPNLTIDDLLNGGFDAVYVAVGTGVDASLEAPGVDLPGIFQASEFLMQAKVPQEHLPQSHRQKLSIGSRVVVIGGGDTASDCLRTALRLGAEQVTCLYRRTEAQMPGSVKDRRLAEEEGTRYRFLTQPVAFHAGPDGRVEQVECVRCELGAIDASGRRSPVPIDGSNFTVEADTVVLALGYWPDPVIGETTPDLETHGWGLITTDPETGATTRPGVFAGGDAVTGPDLVVTAMRAGHRAADAIHRYLNKS